MILENKLGITDSVELAKAEEKISKKRAIELFESGYLNYLKPGTFKSLAEIHKYLFGPIYGFAGQIRTVNISKGNFRFAPIMYLEAALENIEKMPQSTYDEIIINQRIIAGNAQFTGIAAGRGVGFTTGLLLLREGLGMRETPIRPHSWH